MFFVGIHRVVCILTKSHWNIFSLQAEKDRKIAEFQLKVKERLRAMKIREQKDKVNRTLLLTESENLLMKSLDPVKKPPIVAAPLIAINSQVL